MNFEHPSFNYKLPITGKEVKIRPMTIKDEKILLMVEQENNSRIDALKQVLTNCLQTELNLDDLPFIDFQFLFLNLRAISIDNMVTLDVMVDDKHYPAQINLLDYKYENLDSFKKKNVIKFSNEGSIVFRSPSLGDIKALSQKQAFDVINDLIMRCIDSVVFGDQVFDRSNASQAELIDLFENLPAKVLVDINKLFEKAPAMYYVAKVKLEDGTFKDVEVRDFTGFF